jgi:hypothetical protein
LELTSTTEKAALPGNMQVFMHKSSSVKNDNSRENISKPTGNVFGKWGKDLLVQFLIYEYNLLPFNKKSARFTSKMDLELMKKLYKMLHFVYSFMWC